MNLIYRIKHQIWLCTKARTRIPIKDVQFRVEFENDYFFIFSITITKTKKKISGSLRLYKTMKSIPKGTHKLMFNGRIMTGVRIVETYGLSPDDVVSC